jgi:hypothetical protein
MEQQVITLKEPIHYNGRDKTTIIICDRVMADSLVPQGLIQYQSDGEWGYMPIHNILGICKYVPIPANSLPKYDAPPPPPKRDIQIQVDTPEKSWR